jgi:hypothetical protein
MYRILRTSPFFPFLNIVVAAANSHVTLLRRDSNIGCFCKEAGYLLIKSAKGASGERRGVSYPGAQQACLRIPCIYRTSTITVTIADVLPFPYLQLRTAFMCRDTMMTGSGRLFPTSNDH